MGRKGRSWSRRSGAGVRHVPGSRSPQETCQLLGLLDVAVVPHQFVPGVFYLSPLKVIECAAAGCAIVASRQGDIPWLLDDGRVGVVLDDPAIPAWLEAIHGLLDDPNRRHVLGRGGPPPMLLTHFTWRQIAEQHERILQSVVDSTKIQPVRQGQR